MLRTHAPEPAGAVMPDTPAPVRAYQLIYTNVEADLSPARQRGFQVWLCSPELTPEQRRATAKQSYGSSASTMSRDVARSLGAVFGATTTQTDKTM